MCGKSALFTSFSFIVLLCSVSNFVNFNFALNSSVQFLFTPSIEVRKKSYLIRFGVFYFLKYCSQAKCFTKFDCSENHFFPSILKIAHFLFFGKNYTFFYFLTKTFFQIFPKKKKNNCATRRYLEEAKKKSLQKIDEKMKLEIRTFNLTSSFFVML